MQLNFEINSMTSLQPPYDMPFTRVELVLLALQANQLTVLMAKRAEEPFKGRWALPGGVLRIDLDRSLEEAAQRVAVERLGTQIPAPLQVCAVGGPERDPKRAPWALSIVYRSTVNPATLSLIAGKRVEHLRWTAISGVGASRDIAFDHRALIMRAVNRLQEEVTDLKFPEGLLPETFTLGELQTFSEQVLDRRLDKSSFRRKIAERDLVEDMPGLMRKGKNRPAQLYRLR